jgi:hypothetical protein
MSARKDRTWVIEFDNPLARKYLSKDGRRKREEEKERGEVPI